MTTPNPALGDEVFPGQDVGVTDTHPDGGFTVAVVDEYSRLVNDIISPQSGDGMPGEGYSRNAEPGEKMLFWGVSVVDGAHPQRGEYLPYPPLNGVRIPTSPDPVNQFAVGLKWRDTLSRFAHDVMAFNPKSNHLRDSGTYDTGHLPPTDAAAMLKNKATYQLGRAAVGVAFHRVDKWLSFDAQRLAQYPAAVPDAENWKIWQDGVIPVAEDEIPIPNMADMMAMICGNEVKTIQGLCVGAWVYLLNERISASDYDTNMNSGGEIRLPDPTWDQWRPHTYLHRVTGTRSERLDQWAEIMGWFTDAHNHYLESASPTVEHITD